MVNQKDAEPDRVFLYVRITLFDISDNPAKKSLKVLPLWEGQADRMI